MLTGRSGYDGGMTAPDDQPNDTAPVLDGTDVGADPADLDADATPDVPATSDPEQMTEDGDLGGAEDGADVAGDLFGNRPSRGTERDFLDPFGEERSRAPSRRAQRDPDPIWPGTQRSPFGDDEAYARPRRRD